MTNWQELQQNAKDTGPRLDAKELKKRADLVVILDELGVELVQEGDRWNGLCPFHADATPSFAVWWDEDQQADRAGCWSCDFQTGDVFDVVRKMRRVSFKEALAWVNDFINEKQQGLERSTESSSNVPDVDLTLVARDAWTASQTGTQGVLTQFLADKDSRIPAQWLMNEFRVSEEEQSVLIPHFTQDGKNVTALKYRKYPEWEKRAYKGSKYHHLYGSWRNTDAPKVIVCEGETDTWTVAYEFRNDEVDVFGLPTGATTWRDDFKDVLEGRELVLLFDADRAGRTAVKAWAQKFGVVRAAILREGEDAATVTPERLRDAVSRARTIGMAWAPSIVTDEVGGWVRNNEHATPVANFALELVRTIDMKDQGYVFEVRLPDHRVDQLTTLDLGSAKTMTTWANNRGYSWFGTTKDSQEILRMLMMEGPFHPQVEGTPVIGWHEDGFVFPQPIGCIGPDTTVYVPPVADVKMSEKLELKRTTEFDRDALLNLVSIHDPRIITPIIGWVAASPLRSIVSKFPILTLVGGAGYGKTTIMQETLRTFGFIGEPMVLTASTPHAVHSLVSSTNAIPAWFDEYRTGARADSKLVLEQIIRDAWDGSSSAKGGLQENRQALTYLPARAPVIVTGEDVFSETSHIERMVMLPLPRDGRNPEALRALQESERAGFGYTYLNYLLDQHTSGELVAPPNEQGRMKQTKAVVEWGWELLSGFARDLLRVELPPVDLSEVEKVHEEATRRPVIIELLSEFIGRHDHEGRFVVWLENDDVLVRPHELVKGAERYTDIKLPGGTKAIIQWLSAEFEVRNERAPDGRYLRVVGARERVTSS